MDSYKNFRIEIHTTHIFSLQSFKSYCLHIFQIPQDDF